MFLTGKFAAYFQNNFLQELTFKTASETTNIKSTSPPGDVAILILEVAAVKYLFAVLQYQKGTSCPGNEVDIK